MYRRALALSPGHISGQFYLGLVLLARGEYENALATFVEESDPGWNLQGRALAYYGLGQSEAADNTLTELIDGFGHEMAFQIAEVHAYRNEVESAFEWLDTAYAQRDAGLSSIKTDPLMDDLRGDVRWDQFLTKLGFAD